jgi:hypothetical protein
MYAAISTASFLSLSALGTIVSIFTGFKAAQAQARKTNADAGKSISDAAAQVVTMTVTRFEAATHDEALCQQKVERLERYVEMLAALLRVQGISVPPIPPMDKETHP